jgi:hypothetical protein
MHVTRFLIPMKQTRPAYMTTVNAPFLNAHLHPTSSRTSMSGTAFSGRFTLRSDSNHWQNAQLLVGLSCNRELCACCVPSRLSRFDCGAFDPINFLCLFLWFFFLRIFSLGFIDSSLFPGKVGEGEGKSIQSYLDQRDLCNRNAALNGNLAQRIVNSILVPLDNQGLQKTKRDFQKAAKVQILLLKGIPAVIHALHISSNV